MVAGELPLWAGARQDFPLDVRHARTVRGEACVSWQWGCVAVIGHVRFRPEADIPLFDPDSWAERALKQRRLGLVGKGPKCLGLRLVGSDWAIRRTFFLALVPWTRS